MQGIDKVFIKCEEGHNGSEVIYKLQEGQNWHDCAVQVIDKVILKYEEGHDGSEVFQEYENGLQALLSAYSSGSPADHFQLPEQDSSKLVQVISNWKCGPLAYSVHHNVLVPMCQP